MYDGEEIMQEGDELVKPFAIFNCWNWLSQENMGAHQNMKYFQTERI